MAEGDFMILGVARTAVSLLGLLTALMAFLIAHGNYTAYADHTVKILVFPFHLTPGKHTEELRTFGDHVTERLRSSIGLLKETCSLESARTAEELLQGKKAPETDEEARQLAAKADVDLVIYGYLSENASGFSMKAIMWDLRVNRQAVTTDLTVGNVHGLPQILEYFISTISARLHTGPVLPFYTPDTSSSPSMGRSARPSLRVVSPPNQTGPWRSPPLPAEVWAVGIGDLDGDGANETVLLENGTLNISRFQGGNLTPLVKFSRTPAKFFAVEVGNLNDGGPARVIVSSLSPTGVESSIIHYAKRNFKVAYKIPNMILSLIRRPQGDTDRILVGQRTDTEDLFTGKMVRFEFKGEELVEAGTVPLPPGTLLLSYASGEMGKNREFLQIILNQDQRLMVFDKENRLLYEAGDRIYGLDRSLRVSEDPKGKAVTLPGRIMIADTDRDGENELLVIKQSGRVGSINALAWDGEKLVEKWKSIGTRGTISDFTIGDFRNGGIRSLMFPILETAPFLALIRSHSIVFAYDLTP